MTGDAVEGPRAEDPRAEDPRAEDPRAEVLRTDRLRLRRMGPDDLDAVAALLGDPAVMTYYPAPKTRAEAQAWIEWTTASYDEHGFGLWLVETHDGEFVGDCGLTVQQVDGRPEVEVGYHVRSALQGRGYASEAAAAVRRLAEERGVDHLVAIIHPDNLASQRVAERLGLRRERAVLRDGRPCLIFGTDLQRP